MGLAISFVGAILYLLMASVGFHTLAHYTSVPIAVTVFLAIGFGPRAFRFGEWLAAKMGRPLE